MAAEIARCSRSELELSLGWCLANHDLADDSIARFHKERLGWEFAYDFSRAGFLAITAINPEVRK